MKVNIEKLESLSLTDLQIIIEHAELVKNNYKNNPDDTAQENTRLWNSIWEKCTQEKLRRVFEIFEK